MTGKEGYDVLRLIEHGQTCYISSEYVEGRILAGLIKSNPNITKERLFFLMREIANQLGMFHKCRKNPYYQYLNPYSIVVTDEGKLYFLDLEAGSNEKRLRFMQRRAVRECFLPKEEAYYQRASMELDIYGLGKTIQYLLALSKPEPLLNRREERKFLRIISKCLNYQSKASYQSAADIRRNIPQYKKQTEHRTAIRKRLLLAAAGGVILAATWKLQRAYRFEGQAEYPDFHMTQESKSAFRESEEAEAAEENGLEAGAQRSSRSEEYMELALAYLLELEDYDKSLYYLERLQEYAQAVNLKEVAEALMGREKDSGLLAESLQGLEEEAQKDMSGQYCRCLIKGYSLLDTQQSANSILRLSRVCMERLEDGTKAAKEVRVYMAQAYEKLGEIQEAVKLYEELLVQETDSMKREETYQKTAALYEASGQMDRAREICVRGIAEQEGTEELKLVHIRLMCQDASIGRDLCAQTIQEYVRQAPEILEKEEFQKLVRDYEIQMEGEQVWVGR
ncbi:MAG: hypothetical protein HFG82_14695 [Dorea sp.]|nr:hypothetical protein [Dorea sp.]